MAQFTPSIADPDYDTYKHGAFLEKQDRFCDDKPSDVPGPGTYTTEVKVTTSKLSGARSTTDRQAILQRKVDELERLLSETKKTTQGEIERIKADLALARRSAIEYEEQAGKLKKQNETYDARLRELRQINLSDQSEIKELRTKLRAAEHERAQLSAKQGSSSEAKKALQALELRRRSEIQEKDKRIADLDKALAAERKRNEALETRLHETKGKADADHDGALATQAALAAELQDTRAAADAAKASLMTLRSRTSDTEDALVRQLDAHRTMLARAAEEYGRLAAATVPRAVHDQAVRERTTLQLRVFRLERRLANAEGQVQELALLIRSERERNTFLEEQLEDAEAELAFYRGELTSTLAEAQSGSQTASHDEDIENLRLSHDISRELRDSETLLRITLEDDREVWAHLDQLRTQQLLIHAMLLLRHLDHTRHDAETNLQLAARAEAQQAELVRQLAAARAESEKTRSELANTRRAVEQSEAREKEHERARKREQERAKVEHASLERELRREKDARERLAAALQQAQAAEDALTAEIDHLSRELADAEKYEQAYTALAAEVDALGRRHALAEDEAARLGALNAALLGHHNPAQRIQYVDRVRRELHAARQEIATLESARDALAAENDALVRELGLYKSVATPADFRPRATLTRVARRPLVASGVDTRPSAKGSRLEATPEVEYREGDMTVDELA